MEIQIECKMLYFLAGAQECVLDFEIEDEEKRPQLLRILAPLQGKYVPICVRASGSDGDRIFLGTKLSAAAPVGDSILQVSFTLPGNKAGPGTLVRRETIGRAAAIAGLDVKLCMQCPEIGTTLRQGKGMEADGKEESREAVSGQRSADSRE